LKKIKNNAASIDEIKIVVDAHYDYGFEIPTDELIEHNVVNEGYFHDHIDELVRTHAYDQGVENPKYDSEEYASFEEGWMDGVLEIWEQIKDEL
jgi:hypothetical protein